MKKLYFLISALLFSQAAVAQITDPTPYCTSQAQKNYNMWNYIKVGSANHSFGNIGSFANTNTYKYFNNVTFPSVAAGGTVTIELMPYKTNDLEPKYFGVFIDFNNNNVFDDNEMVMKNNNTTNEQLPTTTGSTATAITKTITIPAGTAAGNHRMRLVRAGIRTGTGAGSYYNYDNTANIGACISPTAGGNYGSIYDFDLNITGGLSVDDVKGQKENALRVYPNPVKDLLNIADTSHAEIRKITVYAASGQAVLEKKITDKKEAAVNVSELPKGVYVIRVETAEGEYTDKFIKK